MKIACISDFDLRGSGYFNIASNLCEGLAARGHDVRALGLGYNGQEHWYDFCIVPVGTFQESYAMMQNLAYLWKPDAILVALDIIQQELLISQMLNHGIPYYGVMPVESDPLCMSWAMVMMQMRKAFVISEFGTQEARKVGVQAEHLPIAIDTNFWQPATEEDRRQIRSGLGLEDKFVVLTVADNHERKNLSRTMEVLAEYRKENDNVYWILVTREHTRIGWKLRDLAAEPEIGLSDRMMIMERGIPPDQLLDLFHAADVFLLTSKAEGLGMPVMEAMATKLPVAVTSCTALEEHLEDGKRGYPIEYEYDYRDPFGNGRRYFASVESGVNALRQVANGADESKIKDGFSYIHHRSWDAAIDILERAILEDE